MDDPHRGTIRTAPGKWPGLPRYIGEALESFMELTIETEDYLVGVLEGMDRKVERHLLDSYDTLWVIFEHFRSHKGRENVTSSDDDYDDEGKEKDGKAKARDVIYSTPSNVRVEGLHRDQTGADMKGEEEEEEEEDDDDEASDDDAEMDNAAILGAVERLRMAESVNFEACSQPLHSFLKKAVIKTINSSPRLKCAAKEIRRWCRSDSLAYRGLATEEEEVTVWLRYWAGQFTPHQRARVYNIEIIRTKAKAGPNSVLAFGRAQVEVTRNRN